MQHGNEGPPSALHSVQTLCVLVTFTCVDESGRMQPHCWSLLLHDVAELNIWVAVTGSLFLLISLLFLGIIPLS